MIRYLLVPAFLMLIGIQSAYAMDLQGLLKSIADKPVKNTHFTETRTVFFLDKPMVTEGTLEFRTPDTMIKRITHPENIEQHIEGDVLSIYQNDNSKRTFSLAANSELVTGINAIRWVLSGNLQALTNNFVVGYKNNKSNWEINLVPKDDEVAENIDSIYIKGTNTYISLIEIKQVNGDSIMMDLYEKP